jgi:catechol 2,3-dioxygenase-like lactoylglutathione lyase family enzyme
MVSYGSKKSRVRRGEKIVFLPLAVRCAATGGPDASSEEPQMPGVHAILETALYVDDPQLAANFYQRLFGFKTLLEVERLIALDVASRSVLLLFKAGTTAEPYETPGGIIPPHAGSGPTHFAFSIDADEVDLWTQKLADEGIPLESRVEWPGGAQSLYFRDPDANLVELITPGFWRTY